VAPPQTTVEGADMRSVPGRRRARCSAPHQLSGGAVLCAPLDGSAGSEASNSELAEALLRCINYARLSAVKLAGEPNNPMRVWDNASAAELHDEIMRHLGILVNAGIIDLEALPAPGGRDQSGINGSHFPT
jgi:hypothetical protein